MSLPFWRAILLSKLVGVLRITFTTGCAILHVSVSDAVKSRSVTGMNEVFCQQEKITRVVRTRWHWQPQMQAFSLLYHDYITKGSHTATAYKQEQTSPIGG